MFSLSLWARTGAIGVVACLEGDHLSGKPHLERSVARVPPPGVEPAPHGRGDAHRNEREGDGSQAQTPALRAIDDSHPGEQGSSVRAFDVLERPGRELNPRLRLEGPPSLAC